MCGVYCVKTFSALSDEESGKFSLFQINIQEKRMTEKMCFNRSLTKSQTGVWIHPRGGKGEIRVKKLKLCSASALSAKYPFKQTLLPQYFSIVMSQICHKKYVIIYFQLSLTLANQSMITKRHSCARIHLIR